MMKLYMVRHGQSTANLERIHAGWAQVSLTQQGIREAQQAGQLLAHISFGRVYCSDLLRARQTGQTALPGAEMIETPLLREINVGSLSGKTAAECETLYGKSYLVNKASHDFRPYGGENYAMHLERIRKFAAQMEEAEQTNIAAFCHEGSIRCMLDLVMGQRRYNSDFQLSNGSVTVFELKSGIWTLANWNCLFLEDAAEI